MKERYIMPQQSKLIQLSLVGAILLGLFIGVYLVAGKRFSKPNPADAVVKQSVETPPDEALKYWTPDKMRKAKPAPMPNITPLDRGKQQDLRRPPQTSTPEHS
jgi:hypothetical protein